MGSQFRHEPRFPKPPCDPGRSHFTSPVLTSAPPFVRRRPSLVPSKLKRRHASAPPATGLLAPPSRFPCRPSAASHLVAAGSRNRRVPRAPWPDLCVGASSRGTLGRALPLRRRSYGLMRQTIPLRVPRMPPRHPVLAGCCRSLLGDGPSRHYPCTPCVGAWTHTPPSPAGAFAHFFPEGVGLCAGERRLADGQAR